MSADATSLDPSFEAQPTGAVRGPLLPWPPPGLERLRGDLWNTAASLGVGGSIFVLPMLAALTVPQDAWRPSIFGDAWWILLITSASGLAALIGGFVQLFRVLGRWRAAVRRGYRSFTVAIVLADREGDTGYLIQGARAYSLLPEDRRGRLVSGRVAQAVVAVAAGLWLGVGFVGGVVAAARGLLTQGGLALWTLGPPVVAMAAIAFLRAAEKSLVLKARRDWHAKPWSEDLAREDIQRWHAAMAEREHALAVPAGTVDAGGGPQRLSSVLVAVAGVSVLVLAVPLVTMVGIGPVITAVAVPRFSATAKKAGRAEAFRVLRPAVDSSITLEEAGQAFSALIGPQSGSEMFRVREGESPEIIPRPRDQQGWADNPTGITPERWGSELMPRLAEGIEPSVAAYLRGLGAHPAFASLSVLSRAPALDEVGALYVLPLPETLDRWQYPIPKYSRIREVAYAQVGVAVGEAAAGRVEEAEARLRELIGVGTLLANEGTTLISNLVGVVIAGTGGDALANLYAATGRPEDARVVRERLDAAEAAMRRVAAGSVGGRFEGLPPVVTDTSAMRGLRWEHFGILSALGPCLNLQRAVFGPPRDYAGWVERARTSLVRYEGEQEVFEMMRRGFSIDAEAGGGALAVARVYGQVMGGGVGSCAELLAAATVY